MKTKYPHTDRVGQTTDTLTNERVGGSKWTL